MEIVNCLPAKLKFDGTLLFHDFPCRGVYFYEHHYDEPTYLKTRVEGDNTICAWPLISLKRID